MTLPWILLAITLLLLSISVAWASYLSRCITDHQVRNGQLVEIAEARLKLLQELEAENTTLRERLNTYDPCQN